MRPELESTGKSVCEQRVKHTMRELNVTFYRDDGMVFRNQRGNSVRHTGCAIRQGLVHATADVIQSEQPVCADAQRSLALHLRACLTQ
jgi:hypothetical protein